MDFIIQGTVDVITWQRQGNKNPCVQLYWFLIRSNRLFQVRFREKGRLSRYFSRVQCCARGAASLITSESPNEPCKAVPRRPPPSANRRAPAALTRTVVLRLRARQTCIRGGAEISSKMCGHGRHVLESPEGVPSARSRVLPASRQRAVGGNLEQGIPKTCEITMEGIYLLPLIQILTLSRSRF